MFTPSNPPWIGNVNLETPETLESPVSSTVQALVLPAESSETPPALSYLHSLSPVDDASALSPEPVRTLRFSRVKPLLLNLSQSNTIPDASAWPAFEPVETFMFALFNP